jgi:hypothetical protein
MQNHSVKQPQELTCEIYSQHSIGQVFAALFADLHNLRDKGEGCASRRNVSHELGLIYTMQNNIEQGRRQIHLTSSVFRLYSY